MSRKRAASVIEGIDKAMNDLTDRGQAVRTLDSIIEDKSTHQRDRIRAIEVKSKITGLSERPPLETPARERELSESEKREAALYCQWRFSPAGVAAAKALEAEQPPPQPAEQGGNG